MMIVPLTIKGAKRFTAEHHRHNSAPVGGLFASSVWIGDELRGCAIAGRPVAKALDDGFTVEITRVTTLSDHNACSMLYGALCRASKAIGYRKAITYTLLDEPGVSPRSAGFVEVARTREDDTWDKPGRRRVVVDLFGNDRTPPGGKVRWERVLAS